MTLIQLLHLDPPSSAPGNPPRNDTGLDRAGDLVTAGEKPIRGDRTDRTPESPVVRNFLIFSSTRVSLISANDLFLFIYFYFVQYDSIVNGEKMVFPLIPLF